MNYLMFGNLNSKDYNVFISGENTFATPERDCDTFEIPGRDGTLSLDNGRYHNVSIEYPAFIVHNFRHNYDGFRAALLSLRGYQRLADSYDVDHYRLARCASNLEPEMTQLNRHGTFTLVFDCDPRRFLKAGEKAVSLTSDGVIFNPTLYPAKPLIRAYGTGTLTIGDVTIEITNADGYTDIDCELQEAYKGHLNCNNNLRLQNGEFPILEPGNNEVTFTLSKVEITPRMWTI